MSEVWEILDVATYYISLLDFYKNLKKQSEGRGSDLGSLFKDLYQITFSNHLESFGAGI